MSEPDRQVYDSVKRFTGDVMWTKVRSLADRVSRPFAESLLAGLVYEMRPWQWYKQSILFVAIVFSGNLYDSVAWVQTLQGVVAFSVVASSMYIYNDISDVEEDRNHPEKRHRPIASGQVSVPVAAVFGGLLLAGGSLLAFDLDVLFLFVILAYVCQNVLYSSSLKDVVIVDLLVIAIGFVLRAVAGVFAIDAELSPWLIICAFLAALLLAIGKRQAELENVDDPADTRGVLTEYTVAGLQEQMVVVMAALLMSYTLYTVLVAPSAMLLTLPFAYFGVFWYHHFVVTSGGTEKPVLLAFETPFVVNLLLWVLTVIAVLYVLPDYAF